MSEAERDERLQTLAAASAASAPRRPRSSPPPSTNPESTVAAQQRHQVVLYLDGKPTRAVEGFLIHNGVNVFGDIVCVAGRPLDLAAQGPWFTRGS